MTAIYADKKGHLNNKKMKEKQTTLKLYKKTKQGLTDLKKDKKDSFDKVINNLLDELENIKEKEIKT